MPIITDKIMTKIETNRCDRYGKDYYIIITIVYKSVPVIGEKSKLLVNS